MLRIHRTFILLLVGISLLASSQVSAKKKDFWEEIVTLDKGKSHINYFASEAGDEITVRVKVKSKGGEVQLKVSRIPRSSERPADMVVSPTIIVSEKNNGSRSIKRSWDTEKRSVYEIVLINEGSNPIELEIEGVRDAKSKQDTFNTEVVKVLRSHIVEETYYPVVVDTQAYVVMDRVERVHSRTRLDSKKSHSLLSFYVPANTINWSFFIGQGEDGKAAFREAQTRFLHGASRVALGVPEYGALVALALEGVNYFTLMTQGGHDNVVYALLDDSVQVKKLLADEKYEALKFGNVVTDFGRLKGQDKQKMVWLYLENDNLRTEIDVQIKILAVIGKSRVSEIPKKSSKTVYSYYYEPVAGW